MFTEEWKHERSGSPPAVWLSSQFDAVYHHFMRNVFQYIFNVIILSKEQILTLVDLYGRPLRSILHKIDFNIPVTHKKFIYSPLSSVMIDDSMVDKNIINIYSDREDEEKSALLRVQSNESVFVIFRNQLLEYDLIDIVMLFNPQQYFYECTFDSTGFKGGNQTYLSFPTHQEIIYLPIEDVYKLVLHHKIVHIVPMMEDGVHKKILFSATFKNVHGDVKQRDYVSANHCQEGSDIMIYTLVYGQGPQSISISTLLGLKYEEEEEDGEVEDGDVEDVDVEDVDVDYDKRFRLSKNKRKKHGKQSKKR